MERICWWGCYDSGWGTLITPESYSHPAKAAHGLIVRIVSEGLKRGWWEAGSILIDPFFGVGTTGIIGSAAGLRVIGCELEPRFVAMAEANRELHRREWETMGRPVFEVVHGDSRRLASIVGPLLAGPAGAVTSPPYANRVDDHGVDQPGYEGSSEKLGRYGKSDGQMGNLRIGALTSPPYEGIAQKGGDAGLKAHGTGLTQGERAFTVYGESPGQIGNTQSETYWGACEQVYRQLWELFSPGSHLAVVVKPFVRNKAIVDLPSMTLALLERIGYEPVLWVNAMLVAEHAQADLWGGEKRTKRTSFFRRLYESKYPENAINAEVVLVMKVPGKP